MHVAVPQQSAVLPQLPPAPTQDVEVLHTPPAQMFPGQQILPPPHWAPTDMQLLTELPLPELLEVDIGHPEAAKAVATHRICSREFLFMTFMVSLQFRITDAGNALAT